MRSSRDAGAGGLGGVFSLSDPSGCFLGERKGDRGCLDGVEGEAEATTKSSFVGKRGEKMSVRMVAVLDGNWGEVASGATLGVDGAFSTFVGGAKGFESSEVSVESDALSSSTAMVDEELQVNAGSSEGTGVLPEVTRSAISAGGSGVCTTETLIPHALRQVITGEGHPAFGTGMSA
jgi:hypothetical protein